MITCPICKSRYHGLETWPNPKGGFIFYCPACEWMSNNPMPLPILEIVIVRRAKLREEKDE